MDAPQEVWQDWKCTGSLVSRDRLVEHYLPLARSVAGRIYRGRSEQTVPFDDYLQYARLGLLDSVNRFAPPHGAPFPAYAVHRIRGAILSELTQETEFAAQREAARRIVRERRESLLSRVSAGVERATLSKQNKVTVG